VRDEKGRLRAVAVPLTAAAAVALIIWVCAMVRAARSEGATAQAPEELPVAGIDVNTADAATLESLPSVGPVIAARLVAYREEHGPFRSLQDLRRVKGVTRELLRRIGPSLSGFAGESAEAEAGVGR
jgi:competence protein ComEA